MKFKKPKGALVLFVSPKSSMMAGRVKKEGRKNGAHELYFKDSSNEAVQCLEEDGTSILFFNKKFMVSILSLVPYLFYYFS